MPALRWHSSVKLETAFHRREQSAHVNTYRHVKFITPDDGGPPIKTRENGICRNFAKITTGIKYSSLSPGYGRDRPLVMSRAKERLKGGKETKDSVTLLPCFYFVEVTSHLSICLSVGAEQCIKILSKSLYGQVQ